MTAVHYPSLAEAFPSLTAEIVELLIGEDPGLARTIPDLRFHGRCACAPTCRVLLTAPLGSPSTGVIVLERDSATVALLNYDPVARSVTGIEVLDDRDLRE
ncbi:hypothetical protein [Nocardia sp. NBC_01327]|uniref:hypothetical protein n=1 Tax=Nocardia sp. NBC_01327 TaxID=2903593 RepID=UPI002E160046|nr:hypothetical protein OG326_21060 [Nocardia sp. NBC_01327]